MNTHTHMQRPWRSLAYWIAEPVFFNSTQDHLPRSGTINSGLNPPISIINQEIASTDIPTGQSDKSNFLVKGPSSQVTLVFVKMTQTNQYNDILKDLVLLNDSTPQGYLESMQYYIIPKVLFVADMQKIFIKFQEAWNTNIDKNKKHYRNKF